MKKYLAIILIVSILLSGCCHTAVPDQPTKAEPTEFVPPETEVTAVEILDFAEYEKILSSDSEERNWYFFSMGCLFSDPSQIPLNYLFYLGVGHGGSWNEISPESRQYLIEREFMEEMDLQIMPRETVEQILLRTFGIALADVEIPSEWDYIAAEDAYCSNHNDAYFPAPFTITGVTEYSDGTVEIHYTVDTFYDGKTGEFYDMPAMVMKLERVNHDTLLVVSNTME